MEAVPLVTGAGDLTADWCTRALALDGASVVAVRQEPVGTGQVADTVRLHLTWDPPGAGPPTVVAKVPAADEASRMAARLTRTYEIEASFYRDLAPGLPVRAPHCSYAAHDADTGAYVVVLEDVAPAAQGDQVAGCSPDQVASAVDELALLHGPRWGDTSLTELGWLHRPQQIDDVIALIASAVEPFRAGYGHLVAPETIAVLDELEPHLDVYLRHRPHPWTITHGDFRADNLLFGADRVVVVDWQTVGLGPGASDLSYLLGASLTPDDRRQHEAGLVDRYVAGLRAHGVDVDRATAWDAYRGSAYGGLLMAVIASMLVRRTERGDEMFVAMADRHARQAIDLDSRAVLGT